ncbi:MAG TPA: glycine cleavage T C-terminal barrel domain-containing protein [Pyrinomonadaceae bacterium]|nr:glycine cleavage T C-terminal barrel domain-containing protein [Pyrinomonadaceae bacterium]
MHDYESVREGGAGLIDLSAIRGRIRVTGSEAVMFLNGLITNDMKTLAENQWMPAVFPTVQGRLIGAVRILRKDPWFLIDTDAASHEAVLKTISKFTLAGDFKVADVTTETALLTVQGKRAGEIVQSLGNTDFPIVRATHTGEEGFDLLVEASDAASLKEKLTAAGAQVVSLDTFEILRIEAGIPRHGLDMDETNVVLETNLDDAISYTKGCYLGQEIIVRIKHRGHVAKKLTGMKFDNSVEPGAVQSPDGKEIGRITSVAYSPKLASTVALGYLRYEYLPAGTAVKVGDIAGTVADLPFVRGSWYE